MLDLINLNVFYNLRKKEELQKFIFLIINIRLSNSLFYLNIISYEGHQDLLIQFFTISALNFFKQIIMFFTISALDFLKQIIITIKNTNMIERTFFKVSYY